MSSDKLAIGASQDAAQIPSRAAAGAPKRGRASETTPRRTTSRTATDGSIPSTSTRALHGEMSGPELRWAADASGETGSFSGFLEQLSGSLGLGIVLAREDGRVVQANHIIARDFPGVFTGGRQFSEALDEASVVDLHSFSFLAGPAGEEIARRVLHGGTLRRQLGESASRKHFSHFFFPVAWGSESLHAHCLLSIQPEKQLFDAYRSNLEQLTSMSEVIDLFFESMSSGDVINLILVAVTASQGFGFNRAFFLEVTGDHLMGRLGIGPADAEEAHRIWSRLADSDITLRETLNLFSRAGGPPDLATQRLVRLISLPLEEDAAAGNEGESRILRACRDRRPVRVTGSSTSSPIDRNLFGMLGTDALAVVPLSVQDRLAGVLLADNFITGRTITQDDLHLLKTFAGYAAMALERSHLHDELTRHLEKLRRANHDLQTHQQRLLQAEKLSALGKMAACVSHEIRNPLVAIGGLTRSVLSDWSGSDDSREALEIVVGEVERLERFLNETLTFVRPTTRAHEPVDLVEIVSGVLHTFRDEIQRRNIRLQVELPAEPVRMSADPDLLRGALSNLIRNAQDALRSKGRMRVRLEVRSGLVEISVGDTGPGIPEELRHLIFEPFYTSKDDGTGIGLAITQQNIRNLGGNITLEDDEEYSTLFKIRLPLGTLTVDRSRE